MNEFILNNKPSHSAILGGHEHNLMESLLMKATKLKCIALSLAIASSFAHAAQIKVDEDTVFKPTGKGFGAVDNDATERAKRSAAKAARVSRTQIVYHGGPVMTNPTKLYYIWYGNWSSYTKAQQILVAFGSGIGGTPAFNVNTSYTSAAGAKVVNNVQLAGQYSDNYSKGKALSDQNILDVVTAAISSNSLPNDPNALYFVLTSPDVTETSGFGSQYCGWHANATIGANDVKYSFVGNPITIAPAGCGVNSPSPNGDGGADAMASVMYHELSETVSDPDGNAWYDGSGNENGDKCAWNFGTTFKATNGASANQTFASRQWLLQQMWLNVGAGSCVQKY
ncbi:hypothetical protein E2I14_05680 [Sapientia aquatica]|uniref:Uncharacterized protein n=2 Tax=Sapientia aquatica TaxID=1549640 RepID=A0A4R5W3H5_9BURK|nr:hypothetical protein E2I14_05680 [Sapientia aquatica]